MKFNFFAAAADLADVWKSNQTDTLSVSGRGCGKPFSSAVSVPPELGFHPGRGGEDRRRGGGSRGERPIEKLTLESLDINGNAKKVENHAMPLISRKQTRKRKRNL